MLGSVARGEERTGSDLDLLVDLEPGPTLFDLAVPEERLDVPWSPLTRVRDRAAHHYYKVAG